jgi:hypothetical protein
MSGRIYWVRLSILLLTLGVIAVAADQPAGRAVLQPARSGRLPRLRPERCFWQNCKSQGLSWQSRSARFLGHLVRRMQRGDPLVLGIPPNLRREGPGCDRRLAGR